MQNQNPQSLNIPEQACGPVEIEADMLHLIGGGLPKGTWGSAGAELFATDAVQLTGGETPLPKGTW